MPRVDTEGDGELRERIVRALAEMRFNPNADVTPETWEACLLLADAVAPLFRDVERELARLREAARAVLDINTDRGPIVEIAVRRGAFDALRDVLASAQSSGTDHG